MLLLIVLSADILALTTGSVFMVHPKSKKSVILLNDAHSSYLKMIMTGAEQVEKHAELYQQQKQFITQLAQIILGFDAQRGAQTLVITECPANYLICLAEQEVGAFAMNDSEETIEILSRMFLRQLLTPGADIDEKFEIFKTAVKPFGNMEAVLFELNNKVRWIAADRLRTDEDELLGFRIYQHWKQMRDEIRSGNELPGSLNSATVGNVRRYIEVLHAAFEQYDLVDTYYPIVYGVITEALARKHVTEADHLAVLHAHLVESGNGETRDRFNNNLISFISQKFDAELFEYLAAFEKHEELKYAFVWVGGEHSKQLRAVLLSKGYNVVEEAGEKLDDRFMHSCIEDASKLTELFDALKKDSPFISSILP